jgi:LPXTG-motif cell wall-anchored protein
VNYYGVGENDPGSGKVGLEPQPDENEFGEEVLGWGAANVHIQLMEGNTFIDIAAGMNHSLAIDARGNLWAWGNNDIGQLGNPSVRNYTWEPVQVMDGTRFRYVDAGSNHTLAIDMDGNLWGWGNNGNGQLGDGTTSARGAPMQIMNGFKFSAISAGVTSSYAITTEGTLYGWGDYSWSDSDTAINSGAPVRLGGPETTFTLITASEDTVSGGDGAAAADQDSGAAVQQQQRTAARTGDATMAIVILAGIAASCVAFTAFRRRRKSVG